jgi:hypothetical protein
MCPPPLLCLIRLYLTLKPRNTIYWLSHLIQFCSADVCESGAPKLFFLTCIITLKICKKCWKYLGLAKSNVGDNFFSFKTIKTKILLLRNDRENEALFFYTI